MTEAEHSIVPSTSTSIGTLSFADVERQLPQGVTLETNDGVTSLTVWIKGLGPGLGMGIGLPLIGAYCALTIGIDSVMPALIVSVFGGLYAFVGFTFGKRRITLDGDMLRMRSLPLPLPGDGSLRVEHIDELHIVPIGGKGGSPVMSWRIDAIHHGGKARHLMHDLKTKEQALVLARYLAQEHRLPAPRILEPPAAVPPAGR